MKIFTCLLILAAAFSAVNLEATGSCKRCQMVEANNAKKGPNTFEYYEDYLKAKENQDPRVLKQDIPADNFEYFENDYDNQ